MILRALSRGVYGAVLPGEHRGAEAYLPDLWRQAPLRVALAHTVMAAIVCALCCGRSAEGREAMLLKMLRSRFYPLRLLASAVKGNALMEILREPESRAALLAPNPAATPQRKAPVKTRADFPAEGGAPEADYVIVGSGAAGAAAAVELSEAGKDVLILEEGRWYSRDQFGEDVYSAVSRLFRDFGTQTTAGAPLIPVLQASCVGGSTVISGAITHRLPKAVFDEWSLEGLSWTELEAQAGVIEKDLGIRANLGPLLPSLPVAAALTRLGWDFNAMERSAPGCQGSGRCLQGCPSGGKLSMEASYIPRALAAGARLWTSRKVLKVAPHRVLTAGEEIRARKAVLLAAGVVHSPRLLRASGLGGAEAGRHFQCHLGAAVSALLPGPVVEIEGPPQGLEVTQFAADEIKLATQLVPPELMLARTPVVGRELAELLRSSDRISTWTGSVRSEAEGVVGPRTIRFSPSPKDVERLRLSIARIVELYRELGAERIFPNVAGLPAEVRAPEEILAAPLDPRLYVLGMGHLFGTCRMGSVVGPDFQVRGANGVYVVDASVFPTNIGVNPQLSIMTLARVAARRIAG